MAHSKSAHKVVKIDESDLLCKNGCGFYGNPAWQGFCSKCWREVYQPARQAQAMHDEERQKRHTAPNKFNTAAFSQFEEKKKHQSEKRKHTVKALFKKSPSPAAAQPESVATTSKSAVRRQPSAESLRVSKDLTSVIRTLNKEASADVTQNVRQLMEKLHQTIDSPIEESSEYVINFYQQLSDAIATNPAYKDLPEDVADRLKDSVERYITTRAYHFLFSSAATSDEDLDLVLQDRIRKLHWINAYLLDAEINEREEEVKAEVDKAITEIIEVNVCRTPQDKLEHVVACCKHIFEALRYTKQAPASADEFLPALIYVVLKANPPQLHSNIQFITRFSSPARLMSGEAGYFFTNLCCAVAFIENLTYESLNMSQDDFERYLNGDLIPYNPYRVYNCEGLEMMKECNRILQDVARRQEALEKGTQALKQRIVDFSDDLERKVDEVIKRTPLVLRPRKMKVDLDAETPGTDALPPPLLPMSAVPYVDPDEKVESEAATQAGESADNAEICEAGESADIAKTEVEEEGGRSFQDNVGDVAIESCDQSEHLTIGRPEVVTHPAEEPGDREMYEDTMKSSSSPEETSPEDC